MGYTTEFRGAFKIEPPLNAEEVHFLRKFSETRRMACKQGPYYVDRGGFMGQDEKDPGITSYNTPPDDQPGLWCQWVPTEDGAGLEWSGGEKFYHYEEWLTYLLEHFIGREPIAKSVLPFLQGHVVHGRVKAQGEDMEDRRVLVLTGNVLTIEALE